MTRTCNHCGAAIAADRLAALPHTTQCVPCASVHTPRYRGAMIYDHKTAGALAVFSDSEAFDSFKNATNRKGQQSILRKTTPKI